ASYKPYAQHTVPFGYRQLQLFFRKGTEVDQARRLRLDLASLNQLAVQPDVHRDGSGVRAALAGHADPDGVFSIDVEAVGDFDRARIDTADAAGASSLGRTTEQSSHSVGGLDRLWQFIQPERARR